MPTSTAVLRPRRHSGGVFSINNVCMESRRGPSIMYANPSIRTAPPSGRQWNDNGVFYLIYTFLLIYRTIHNLLQNKACTRGKTSFSADGAMHPGTHRHHGGRRRRALLSCGPHRIFIIFPPPSDVMEREKLECSSRPAAARRWGRGRGSGGRGRRGGRA